MSGRPGGMSGRPGNPVWAALGACLGGLGGLSGRPGKPVWAAWEACVGGLGGLEACLGGLGACLGGLACLEAVDRPNLREGSLESWPGMEKRVRK